MRGGQALRVLGVTVAACIAFGAFAGSAQAGFTWIVNGNFLKEGETHKVTCERAATVTTEVEGEMKNVTIPFVLKGTVGEVKIPVELEFGKVNCVENIVYNEKGVAYSKGKFEFQEPKVLKPTGCTVKGFVSKSLTGRVKEYAGLAPEEGITYSPEAEGGSWAAIPFEGVTCSVAGNRIFKGFTVARIVPGVFEEGKIPEWLFDSGTEAATGSELLFAGNPATLGGALKFFW